MTNNFATLKAIREFTSYEPEQNGQKSGLWLCKPTKMDNGKVKDNMDALKAEMGLIGGVWCGKLHGFLFRNADGFKAVEAARLDKPMPDLTDALAWAEEQKTRKAAHTTNPAGSSVVNTAIRELRTTCLNYRRCNAEEADVEAAFNAVLKAVGVKELKGVKRRATADVVAFCERLVKSEGTFARGKQEKQLKVAGEASYRNNVKAYIRHYFC